MKHYRHILVAAAVALTCSCQPSHSQYLGQNSQYSVNGTGFGGVSSYRQTPKASTMQSLEQTLDTVDNRNAWSRTPVSGAVQQPPYQQIPQSQQRSQYQQQSQSQYQQHPQYQQQPQYQQPYNVSAQNSGMLPKVTKRDLARVFFEGGSLFDSSVSQTASSYMAPAPSGNNSQATSVAYQGYQRAQNMSTRARNAASRARNSTDQWVRKKAADEAYYDANDADAAANRAYYAAQNGDSQARGYANLARQAADRARADANRARYNADTIR